GPENRKQEQPQSRSGPAQLDGFAWRHSAGATGTAFGSGGADRVPGVTQGRRDHGRRIRDRRRDSADGLIAARTFTQPSCSAGDGQSVSASSGIVTLQRVSPYASD